jgi:hypothetical protein
MKKMIFAFGLFAAALSHASSFIFIAGGVSVSGGTRITITVISVNPARSFVADTSAYIRVPYSSSIGVRDEIAVGAWVKFTQNGNFGVISRNGYPTKRVWGLETWNLAALSMLSEDGVVVRVAPYNNNYPVGDGRWHHLAFTYKDTAQAIYVDGASAPLTYLTDNRPWAGSPALLGNQSSLDMTIGALLGSGSASDLFQGNIYQPRVFHKQLSSAQIQEWFNSGQPIELSNLSFSSDAVASYRFDSSDTEAVVHDESGHANNGTLNGGSTSANFVSPNFSYRPRWNGWHLNFNGSTQYVTVPHASSLNLATSFTVMIALKYTDVSGEQVLISKADYGTGNRSWFVEKYFSDRSKIALFLSPDGGAVDPIISTATVSDGNWHTYAFTLHSGTGAVTTYVDGVQDTTGTLSGGNVAQNTVPVLIGAIEHNGTPNLLYTGALDEPRIYNAALTAQQIADLHYAMVYNDVDTTALSSGGNMVLGFRCGDDQSGTGTPAFSDISGNSNSGTNSNLTSGSFVSGP